LPINWFIRVFAEQPGEARIPGGGEAHAEMRVLSCIDDGRIIEEPRGIDELAIGPGFLVRCWKDCSQQH
jgi:hypothetical protein